MPRHLFHRFVRMCIKSAQRWHDRGCSIRELEDLDELGTGIIVAGRIQISTACRTSIGDGVSINPRFVVRGGGGLVIGSHVHIGEDVKILTENHKYDGEETLPYDRQRVGKRVTIGDCRLDLRSGADHAGRDVSEKAPSSRLVRW